MKSELGLAAAKMAVPLLVPRLIYYFYYYYYYYYYYCPASSTTNISSLNPILTISRHAFQPPKMSLMSTDIFLYSPSFLLLSTSPL